MIPNLPVGSSRGAVQNLSRTVGVDVELKDRCALGTERPFVMRAARIAFDIDDLAVDGVNQRAATDGAVGTDTRRHGGAFDSQFLRPGDHRAKIDP